MATASATASETDSPLPLGATENANNTLSTLAAVVGERFHIHNNCHLSCEDGSFGSRAGTAADLPREGRDDEVRRKTASAVRVQIRRLAAPIGAAVMQFVWTRG
ncbi:hypothetical protein GCM10022223_39790 [Kineosporia mesophila]|uniref:Uncharacterized protein n=1 Tax=Kineosporia mesophila TaxID=566012 RepID=A0ABP6ZZ54_9ACTN